MGVVRNRSEEEEEGGIKGNSVGQSGIPTLTSKSEGVWRSLVISLRCPGCEACRKGK